MRRPQSAGRVTGTDSRAFLFIWLYYFRKNDPVRETADKNQRETMKSFRCFITAGLIMSLMLSGCGGARKTTDTQQWRGPSKVKIELDECQVMAQQKPELRTWGEGINFRLSTASNYAEMQARGKLKPHKKKADSAIGNLRLTRMKARVSEMKEKTATI